MIAPILVFDIETVPDVKTGKRLYPNLQSLSDDDAQAAMIAMREAEAGNAFMRQPLHKIVCLSFLWVDGENGRYYLRSLSLDQHSEKEILATFLRAFDKNPLPTLVSYNGAGFDLQVILYRMLHHGLSAPRLFGAQNKYGYTYRYSDMHIDLIDKLALYNNYNRQKLDTVAALCGFAGKGDMDGSMVVPIVQQGRWDELRHYCESDVINTWFIFLRYRLLVGQFTDDQYRAAVADIQAYLGTLVDDNGEPRFGVFLENADASDANDNADDNKNAAPNQDDL